jgi:hypothetical protein
LHFGCHAFADRLQATKQGKYHRESMRICKVGMLSR